MKNTKKENLIFIEKHIELVNKFFPFKDLKGRVKERELLSVIHSRDYINTFKKFDCVQKIYYGKGSNSYYYYAPTGFKQFMDNLDKIYLFETLNKKLKLKETKEKKQKI